MKRKTIVFLTLLMLVLAVGVAGASSKHVLLISNPQMTLLWSDYLSNNPNITVTVANEPDLIDDIFGVFDAEAIAGYDAFVIGELFMEAGRTGATLMTAEVQDAIKARVAEGAGLVLAGGWNSYQGGMADWSGNWHGTSIAEILPVEISADWDTNDTGVENPEIFDANHPIVAGLDWANAPRFGGYNLVTAKVGASVIAGDAEARRPVIVAGTYGEGNTVAYAGGFGSGWDQDFIQWSDFEQLWVQLIDFLLQ